ncbi:MAG TPA: TspO/MBR family protein [Burkholderiales bacterium]|nr:TspO/MBR family protein [Burkholderiales bacterium]
MTTRLTTNSPLSLSGLFAWLLVAFSAAAVGAIASVDAAAFYGQLVRPSWAPPAGAFGPVWSVLYALMGVAAWFVWRAGRRHVAALAIFVVQLVVNALWSWLFFAWRLGALAFIDALILFGLIVATILLFWRASRLAAVLLLPYLAWVGFACALTWAVWKRNPGLLT